MRTMIPCILVGTLWLPAVALAGERKAETTGPAWQRLLQGKDASQAATLEARIEAQMQLGKWPEARKAAVELAALRADRQGKEHWEAVNARWTVAAIQSVEGAPAETKRTFAESLALEERASALENKARYVAALPMRQKLLAICRQVYGEEHPFTAEKWNSLASNQKHLGKYAEAEVGYRKALAIWRKVLGEKHPDTAKGHANLALNQQIQGKYAEAAAGYRKALAICLEVHGEEHFTTALCYHHLAGHQAAQGKYAEAEGSFRKALATFKKTLGDEHPFTLTVQSALAYNQHEQGKYAWAEQGQLELLAIYRKVFGERHPQTASAYNRLALAQEMQGKYAEAEAGHRKALAIRREMLGEAHTETAQSYGNLALTLQAQGKYADAEKGLVKALAIRRKALGEEHPATATAYNNVALNQNAQGRYALAEAGYRRALAIWRKVHGEEHPTTATSWANLAFNQDAQGRYVEAEEGHRRALAIRRKVLGEEHADTITSYINLAMNQNDQGKYAQAEEGLRQALALARKVLGEEHRLTAVACNNLALNQLVQRKYPQAADGYLESLALQRKIHGEEHTETAVSLSGLAFARTAQGRYAEAEKGFREALAINRKVLGEQHPQTSLGYRRLALNLHRQGKYAEAEELATKSAAIFARTRLQIAATGLDRAAITGEQSPLSLLAALLARNGKPTLAWQRFEESLGRGTGDDLAARLKRPPAERQRQTQLLARLRLLENQLQKLAAVKMRTPAHEEQRRRLLDEQFHAQDALAKFSAELEEKYGPVAGQVLDLPALQKALPTDAAFLAWLDRQGEHWAVLLKARGDPIWVRLPGTGTDKAWGSGDEELPTRTSAALTRADSDWQPLARKLHAQRLAPLAKHLEGIRKLIVLPSSAMESIPIEVIAEGFTVSYAQSASLFAHQKQQPRPRSAGLVALGDPIFKTAQRPADRLLAARDSADWQPLPGTRFEIGALKKLFATDRPTLLLGSDASETRLAELSSRGTLGEARFVHLATHGEARSDKPLASRIILSRDHLGEDQRGELSAEQVLTGWNLNAELVTLSACQTGLGKHERGEGFVGFAQALQLAGARSVCLSRWSVNDLSTALLMERFYQNMLGKRPGLKAPLGKAAALSEAKQWLRTLPRAEALKRAEAIGAGVERAPGAKELPRVKVAEGAKDQPPYAHPYYWAGFVLVGDPD